MSPLDPVRVSGLHIPVREIDRGPESDDANEIDVFLATQTTCLAEVVASADRADQAEVLEQIAQSVVSAVSAG
jgi:putative heme iron utilization protein